MGSCVSKKAARGSVTAGAKAKAPQPPQQLPPEKDNNAVPPVVVEEEEEEVKEVLSETAVPRPPRPPEPEPEHEKVKKKAQQEDEEQQGSDSVSAGSSIVEKPMLKSGRSEQEALEDSPPGKARERRKNSPSEQLGKSYSKDGGNGSIVRARSPSPGSSGHSRRQQSAIAGQQQPVPVPVPRPREQPAVVSGIGCRSGRFYSPSAARRAAESAVRRTYSAREADMALPSSRTSGSGSSAKRSLHASINGNGVVRRGDTGERSGRRSDSPTARRPPASPAANGSAISRQGSATRRAPPKEDASPEKIKQQCGRGRVPVEVVEDEFDGPALSGKQHGDAAAEGPLGQNPSVAMECFIFL
ncbi:CLK4-associating serine/arginine rich protein [Brachypodium distachyon]|uniref:Uncharacterized protein n=1 Tax=Brachypodium distachyon TaxID=15368 RepID=I1GQK3_BRADI|nr:CLK4-associating serine/arginine rich protein [Brachypodium distachyon]KQK14325.2 hypothetical protein BRADI_1g15460v3 [Brachypodium distachyon]|eukprot:XP_010233071.1 CLK4-associating serine/arginine rich protein [Brachypodium distachyon]